MDEDRYQNAVFIMNTADQQVTVSLPLKNVSSHFDCNVTGGNPEKCPTICGRDMYTGEGLQLTSHEPIITTTLSVRTQRITKILRSH